MAQPRSGARRPATKFAHLRKKLQKAKASRGEKPSCGKPRKRRAS